MMDIIIEDGRYERESSPMMSPIISPVSACLADLSSEMRSALSEKFLPKNRGCATCESHIYSHDFFESIFACHVSGHAIIISIKQYSGMDIFSSNPYFAYGVWDVYANHEVIPAPSIKNLQERSFSIISIH